MIVPMMKYSFVVHTADYEDFLERLQELGMVDITVSGWEASESEYRLMELIEKERAAVAELTPLTGNSAEPYASPEQTLEAYIQTSEEIAKTRAEAAKAEREMDEAQVFGSFSPETLRELKDGAGVEVRVFTAYAKEYNAGVDEWSRNYAIEKIAEKDGIVYFAVVSYAGGEPVAIDATEVKLPQHDHRSQKEYLASLHKKLEELDGRMHRAAAGLEPLREYGARLKDKLAASRVTTTARREADGTLVLMEGWAAEKSQSAVDAFAESEPVVVFKEKPTHEDEPPVLLKNNSFASLFEVIGGLYALPKYGTMDMTGLYAPFFMLFFGFCMGDMGYGLLFVAAAMLLYRKVAPSMKPILRLVMLCGGSAMVFGFLTGNLFGIALGEWRMFEGIREYFLTTEMLFPISLGVGVVHIYYAMIIRVVAVSRTQGFKYTLNTIGWMIALGSILAGVLLPEIYPVGSVPFMIVTGAGVFMMLFLNNPDRNPLKNFGAGLWNTYNDITGFIGDVLSYLRLFALCLSGGILALVFNRLAMEMSPDIIVVKQLVMILILAVGQGLNLFMTTLSSFVHPLRLTFVEFYKNAGFEAGGRRFDPLKKNNV